MRASVAPHARRSCVSTRDHPRGSVPRRLRRTRLVRGPREGLFPFLQVSAGHAIRTVCARRLRTRAGWLRLTRAAAARRSRPRPAWPGRAHVGMPARCASSGSLLGFPAGEYEVALLARSRPQQHELLETGLLVDHPGASGEPLLQLGAGARRDFDGVDLDDGHVDSLARRTRERSRPTPPQPPCR